MRGFHCVTIAYLRKKDSRIGKDEKLWAALHRDQERHWLSHGIVFEAKCGCKEEQIVLAFIRDPEHNQNKQTLDS